MVSLYSIFIPIIDWITLSETLISRSVFSAILTETLSICSLIFVDEKIVFLEKSMSRTIFFNSNKPKPEVLLLMWRFFFKLTLSSTLLRSLENALLLKKNYLEPLKYYRTKGIQKLIRRYLISMPFS